MITLIIGFILGFTTCFLWVKYGRIGRIYRNARREAMAKAAEQYHFVYGKYPWEKPK